MRLDSIHMHREGTVVTRRSRRRPVVHGAVALLAASMLWPGAAHGAARTQTEGGSQTFVSNSFGRVTVAPPAEVLVPISQFRTSEGTLQTVQVGVRTVTSSLNVQIRNNSATQTARFTVDDRGGPETVTFPGFEDTQTVPAVDGSEQELGPGQTMMLSSDPPPFVNLDRTETVPGNAVPDYVGPESVVPRVVTERGTRLRDISGLTDENDLEMTVTIVLDIEVTVTYTFEPPPLPKHFACYTVLAAQKLTPETVTLTDQFRDATMTVARAASLCNPADKNGEDPDAPAAPDHLVAYSITQSVAPKFSPIFGLEVEDQFGARRVDALTPDRLLVPSAKSLVAEPAAPDDPGVDHFVCYTIQTSAGTPKFVRVPGVTVVDQFGTRRVDLAKLSRLCNPVNKNGEEPGAEGHPGHLLCYETQPSPGTPRFTAVSPIYVANQFGPQELKATTAGDLCVPARKGLPI